MVQEVILPLMNEEREARTAKLKRNQVNKKEARASRRSSGSTASGGPRVTCKGAFRVAPGTVADEGDVLTSPCESKFFVFVWVRSASAVDL